MIDQLRTWTEPRLWRTPIILFCSRAAKQGWLLCGQAHGISVPANRSRQDLAQRSLRYDSCWVGWVLMIYWAWLVPASGHRTTGKRDTLLSSSGKESFERCQRGGLNGLLTVISFISNGSCEQGSVWTQCPVPAECVMSWTMATALAHRVVSNSCSLF